MKKGKNYAFWNYKPPDKQSFEKLTFEDKSKVLIAAAHASASTHNTQPWSFKIDNKGNIKMFIVGERVLAASDVNGRQAIISMGWAIENMYMAADYYGYKLEYVQKLVSKDKIPIQSNNKMLFANLKLQKNIAKDVKSDFWKIILNRRVERGEYDTGKNISKTIQNKIAKIYRNGVSIKIIDSSSLLKSVIAELQSFADGYVANNSKFASELSDWLLENDTDSYLGMPGDTFHLSDKIAREIRKGLKDKKYLKADHITGVVRATQHGILSASILGIILVEEDNIKNWIKGGRKLAKTAFLLEKEGIVMAFHGGIAEVKLARIVLKKYPWAKGTPLLLFRAGYPRSDIKRAPHSPRLPLEKILI